MRKWKPSANPRDPSVWLTLENFMPTPRGTYKTPPIFTTLGTAGAGPASPGDTLAAHALHTAGGTVVVYVGTSTKLYSATAANFQAGSFTDRTKSGGYTASSWSFAAWGNYHIATNKTDAVQVRDGTGSSAFADLGGSPPKAKIVVTQSNVVLLFNINDGTDKPSSWAASDVGSHTTWSGGDSVGATPILHRPGEITAALAFRDYVLVFKRNSIYMMRYVGAPIMWTVDLVDDTRGVTSPGSVCNCGEFVIFSGMHGVTIWDGSGFRDVSDGFQSWQGLSLLALNVGTDNAIYYPAERTAVYCTGSDLYYYNAQSDTWGYSGIYRNGTIKRAGYKMLAGTPAARADALGAFGYDLSTGGLALVNLSADGTGTDDCVVVSTDAWTPDSSIKATLGTSYMGDERTKTTWKRLTPLTAKSAAQNYSFPSATGLTLSATVADAPDGSGASTFTATSSTNTRRFDFAKTGRFFKGNVSVTGAAFEMEDVVVDAVPAGTD